jgi:hypothetical protein
MRAMGQVRVIACGRGYHCKNFLKLGRHNNVSSLLSRSSRVNVAELNLVKKITYIRKDVFFFRKLWASRDALTGSVNDLLIRRRLVIITSLKAQKIYHTRNKLLYDTRSLDRTNI